jgi:histidinol phosphatase-like enzyme
VSLKQLEEALRYAPIGAVQVELSALRDDNLWNGVAARCAAERIPLLAYRPLGGPERREKLGRDTALVAVAARHAATPFEIALAWLWDLSPFVVPIPGATRLESVASLVRAHGIRLDDEDRARLDQRFPAGRILRERPAPEPRVTASAGEVVLIMGLPGAGKSTLAQELVGAGYDRLNRDEAGGRLSALLPPLDLLLAAGRKRVVLDNTYVTRKSRAAVVAKAGAHGLPVRCVWLKARIEDAQVNAVHRMLARYGRLLEPDAMRAAAKSDPGAFGPGVQFRYERDLEPPDPSEGFSRIDLVPFVRKPDAGFTNRALVVWLDGLVWRSLSGKRTPDSPQDLDVLPGRAEALQRHAAEGFLVFGLTWQPELEAGERSKQVLQDCFEELTKRLGPPLEVLYCPHGAGPPVCWCRKPLPGLGVELVVRHRLDRARCLYVGSSSLDRTFAERLGFAYRDQAELFGPSADPSA